MGRRCEQPSGGRCEQPSGGRCEQPHRRSSVQRARSMPGAAVHIARATIHVVVPLTRLARLARPICAGLGVVWGVRCVFGCGAVAGGYLLQYPLCEGIEAVALLAGAHVRHDR